MSRVAVPPLRGHIAPGSGEMNKAEIRPVCTCGTHVRIKPGLRFAFLNMAVNGGRHDGM
jgi:hypothetical protein